MSGAINGNKPPLAGLVLAGDQQAEAVAITDFIFMAQDVSNSYLVTTADGDLMVNTGFTPNAPRNQALLAPRRTGALRYIVLTQSHADHYGGIETFLEPGTKVVVERRFAETHAFYKELGPYHNPRAEKLWGTIVSTRQQARPPWSGRRPSAPTPSWTPPARRTT